MKHFKITSKEYMKAVKDSETLQKGITDREALKEATNKAWEPIAKKYGVDVNTIVRTSYTELKFAGKEE